MKTIISFFLGCLLACMQLPAQVLEDGFTQSEITDAIFAQIKGKSFKDNCTTPRADLRYLQILHYNKDGEVLEGEMICHKSIANDLLAIFQELYKAK